MIARRVTGIESAESERTVRSGLRNERRIDVLQMIWRQRWVVLLTLLVCLGAGVAYIVKARPMFESTSRVCVQQNVPRILSDTGSTVSESSNYLAQQCEVITSVPVLTAVAQAPETQGLRTFARIDNVVGYLHKNLSATVDPKNDLITVAFASPYPEDASRIVNATVDQYVSFMNRQKHQTAAQVLKLLQDEKTKTDTELDQKLKKMMTFKQAHPTLSFESGENRGNVILETLARLSDAMTTAKLATIDAKTTFELLNAQGDAGAKSSTASDIIKGQLIQLEERQDDLSRVFGPNNRQLQAVTASIARLKALLADADQNANDSIITAARQQWEVATRKEKEIASQVAEQEKQAISLNSDAAEYALLQADLKSVQDHSAAVDSRIRDLNVTEDAGMLNITILETARPGTLKSITARVMGMALLLGLMLGSGLGLVRETSDQRVGVSAEEVSQALSMPVLGVIPHMPADLTVVQRGQSVHLEPMCEVAEAYRTIRTAICFGVPAEFKTLLVTSPSPGDGKTTSASNIAIAMAQAGNRTLIIDCDFRKPTQHKIFEVDDQIGLCGVIAGRDKLRDAIRRSPIEALHVLPCGPIPGNPAEILNGKRFGKVMEALAGAYDKIIIDSPPLGPVSDARILAASADVTVLVLRAEKSTRKTSEHARDGLESVGANILGIVLNDIPRRRGRSAYYSGYGYQYGYGSGSGRRATKITIGRESSNLALASSEAVDSDEQVD